MVPATIEAIAKNVLSALMERRQDTSGMKAKKPKPMAISRIIPKTAVTASKDQFRKKRYRRWFNLAPTNWRELSRFLPFYSARLSTT